MRIKTETRIFVSLLLTACLLALPATAFAKKGDKHYKDGLRNEQNQQWEKAAQDFTLALAADPSNWEYQLHFRRAAFNASQSYMQQGRSLAEQGDFIGAYNAFRQAFGYDPVNELAVSEMERMLRLQSVRDGTDKAPKPIDNGTAGPNGAQEPVLPAPRTEQLRVISYSGDLKAFIRSLAEQLNLNVIFDRQSFVQPRTIDINLRDVTTSQALDYIFLQESMFFQKLSRRTILVADQTRRPQYQQLVLRTFFLANSDPEKAKTLVGQAIPPSVGRPQTIVVADKDTNSLTIRDTAENVRLIGELIQSIDKDRAEVVMDVNIYEISRTDLLQFGSQWGSDATLVNLGGIQKGWSLLSGGATTVGLPVSFGTALMIPSSALAALQSKNRGKLVASTQVHAFNGEESTARIGQRVPVQTAQAYPFGVQTGTGTTNNGFPTGGFPVINYEPTGLTLKFTPQVFPNQDVQVKMSIESKDVLGANTLTPTFTERTITGTARVQNNRTMMLASVSTASHNEGRRGLPIVSGLPILGRFFSAPTSEDRTIDIVIAVTPRVLRAPAVTPRDEEMRPSGTLQSPTTGSLEAMLREADREDQLAEFRLQQKNQTAQMTPPPSAPGVFKSNAPVVAATQANTPATTDTAAVNTVAQSTNNPATQTADNATQPTAQQTGEQIAKAQAPTEELPAYVPAPKSLVSTASATEVAAVNTGLKTDAGATLASLPKPIDAAIGPISARHSAAQLSLTPVEQSMRVRETRRFALELKSGSSLALAMVSLRFDPKVVRVTVVSAAVANGGTVPVFNQSTDPSGVCLISLSNLTGTPGINSTTLVFIDVEGLAPGDAGLVLDKDASRLVGIDAKDVLVEVVPARAIVKQ